MWPVTLSGRLLIVACTQDELAGDNRLPEGEYPVFIRATGLSVEATPLAASSTRAAVDGDWQGVTVIRCLTTVQLPYNQLIEVKSDE